MAEIYRNSIGKGLTFSLPSSDASVLSATLVRGDDEYVGVTQVAGGTTQVALPYDITRYSGKFYVRWTFRVTGKTYGPSTDPADPLYTVGPNPLGLTPYDTETEEHFIVTPVFTQQELTDWDSDFTSLSAAKVVYLESLVRQIIQTYCNQKFEYSYDTTELSLASSGVYYSSDKVIRLEDATYSLGDGGYSVYNLDTYTSQGYDVKIPIEAEAYEINKGWHAPRAKKSVQVSGWFGWVSLPSEVKTAALYLAESFTCDESLWRERYIKSVRAADWRFDYSEEAFHSTGSVIADQILDPFKRIGFAAV